MCVCVVCGCVWVHGVGTVTGRITPHAPFESFLLCVYIMYRTVESCDCTNFGIIIILTLFFSIPGLRKGDAIALTFFMTLIFVALITAAIAITVMWFVCVKRNATMATSPKTNGDHSMSDYKVGNTAKVETTPSTRPSRPPRPPTRPKV